LILVERLSYYGSVISKIGVKMGLERHENNPFLENMVVPLKGRQVRLSRLGKDDNVLVNQVTGEVLGTHVTTYRAVDGDQFVKLFTANIGLAFDLTAAGIKSFAVLMWVIQNHALAKDEVPLDVLALGRFLRDQPGKRLSLTTFKRGLSELERAQIIAKTMRKGFYFINPNFVFNGDRVAFSTVLEKERIEGISKSIRSDDGRCDRTEDMFDPE
jgi:hypothetical protein